MERQETILIVDDDSEIRRLLSDYLTQSGYVAKVAADGRDLLKVIERSAVNLIVLDLMMPGKDGLMLCREVRARSDVPIIMLTSRGELVDRIIGLEMGADDYLPKPFDPRELLVRVQAVLRRAKGRSIDVRDDSVQSIEFAGWQLDTVARHLTSPDGVLIALSGAEYQLLRVFLDHPSRILTRDRLTTLLMGKEADPFERAVDVRVSRLRQRLLEDAREPQIIKTVRSEGYLLAVTVKYCP
ncbi:response regulator [Burkholderia sp. S171]|uniref:response regulator n=1 Tax=Burkholderia sp. S171 TaxID=1641860 RepID=UPI00131D508F|nr:response regulator [Burkholderia sp. S171]